jgi:hypothetical protein
MRKELLRDAIRKHIEEGSNEEQKQTVDCEEEQKNQVVAPEDWVGDSGCGRLLSDFFHEDLTVKRLHVVINMGTKR